MDSDEAVPELAIDKPSPGERSSLCSTRSVSSDNLDRTVFEAKTERRIGRLCPIPPLMEISEVIVPLEDEDEGDLSDRDRCPPVLDSSTTLLSPGSGSRDR